MLIKILYGKERKEKIKEGSACYHPGDQTIYVAGDLGLSGLSKTLLVEEFAHALQNQLYRDGLQRRTELMPILKNAIAANNDELKQQIGKELTEINKLNEYNPDNEHSYMEVEAKLIVHLVKREAIQSKRGRNGWGTPEPESVFESYTDAMSENDYPIISTEPQIDAFFKLQGDFEDYYNDENNVPKGVAESYKKGKKRQEPILYNQLRK